MTNEALIGLLLGVFLIVIALIVFQEARRRPELEEVVYVIDDAIGYIQAHLAVEGMTSLDRGDIRRILEWEIFYLQGLAQEDRRNPVETVAGGHEASVEYIVDQIAVKHGVTYSRSEVEDVLRHEAGYLMSIGAVGERVDFGGEEE